MNLSKKIFQKSTYRTMTAAVLVAGLSMPLYAAETTESVDPAANVVTTTKVVTTTTTTRVAKHKAHHAKSKTSRTTEVQADTSDPERAQRMKLGIVLHDVEPTGQSTTPFGAPTSTTDTLKGGVTSTISPAPTQ